MYVQIKRTVIIDGTTYGIGQHDMPDEHTNNWFFEALVKDHDAVILHRDVDDGQKSHARRPR